MCEQNIALAFEQAKDEGAVLTLDEADSFLADRRDARARWELTETNELLTQIERFDGLFICTTNLMERLDRAALRRFAVKLRFDYLRSEQMCALVGAALIELGIRDILPTSVQRLQGVTPGDVAAVIKRCRLVGGSQSAESFVQMLSEEIALKGEGAAHSIGF